jgi:hypothetical protein
MLTERREDEAISSTPTRSFARAAVMDRLGGRLKVSVPADTVLAPGVPGPMAMEEPRMTEANVWLILDSGVAVSRVAYASPATAERDAEVLRAEASEALGYGIPDGQIEVYGVQIVDQPIYGLVTAKGTSNSSWKVASKGGTAQDVDPFAAPPGYRLPAGGGAPRRHAAYRYESLEEVDPFAPPGCQAPGSRDPQSTNDAAFDHDGSRPARSDRRRHLTLVRCAADE